MKKILYLIICVICFVSGCGALEEPENGSIKENVYISDSEVIIQADTKKPEETFQVATGSDEDIEEINNESEMTLEEKDFFHYQTRLAAAKPYENEILPEYKQYYEINDRVIGYIVIEGTDVDCPVIQKLEDYDYYLTHDIYDKDSAQGCIILDPDSEIGIGTKEKGYLSDYEPSTNMLVHGHNMKSGTMFGALQLFAKQDYADAHPYIVFDSLYEHRKYEIVLAFYSQVFPEESKEFKYYNFNNAKDEKEFKEWYDNICELELYHRSVDVQYGDEMITLSTCSYQTENGRFAVVGKRIE